MLTEGEGGAVVGNMTKNCIANFFVSNFFVIAAVPTFAHLHNHMVVIVLKQL